MIGARRAARALRESTRCAAPLGPDRGRREFDALASILRQFIEATPADGGLRRIAGELVQELHVLDASAWAPHDGFAAAASSHDSHAACADG